ncbi:MAG: sigma-70 family RNA polymerase sigma factor [Candidatus Poribacteria bacterium]|nr:sigma-70 family RNA polymerase sigma factor [Candidatus Poribacteria bacterium]
MERTECLLIEDLRAGDMTALAVIVEKHKRHVYRLAFQITKNHEDANDVMQDTFLKVYESIHSFRKESAFETWLYRIVVNQAINLVKRRERRREAPLSGTTETQIRSELKRASNFRNNPHLSVERKELQRHVTQAVNSLPIKHRMVVILHEFEGLTHPKIASILNCSEGTVRSRLHYARKKLRERLKSYVELTNLSP